MKIDNFNILTNIDNYKSYILMINDDKVYYSTQKYVQYLQESHAYLYNYSTVKYIVINGLFLPLSTNNYAQEIDKFFKLSLI